MASGRTLFAATSDPAQLQLTAQPLELHRAEVLDTSRL
jgi:hypothetical protein